MRREKLYSLIISRLDGEGISEPSYRKRILELVKKGIGGFIVFGGACKPFGGETSLRSFLIDIQALSQAPLFIASDIERGVGQQVRGYTGMPCQMAQAAALGDDMKTLTNLVTAISKETLDAGINMPLIPVLDVNTNPDNPIISTRAFSDNPEVVSRMGNIYVKTLQSHGLISCPKHFPGHGDTAIDSHIALPVITKSKKELMKTDIAPFKAAISAGADSIMAGHLLIPSLDKLPASLSRKTLTGLLRKGLGFEGLILTDALNMDALREFGDASTLALKAGADILLHPKDPDETVKELSSALDEGELNETHITSALQRISRAKRGLNRHKGVRLDITKFGAHERLSTRVTEMSITLVKESPGLLPLKGMNIVFAGDEKLYKDSPLKEMSESIDSGAETTVVAIFTAVSAWRGTSGISAEDKERIKRLIKKSVTFIVISFGSPYVLGRFMEADALISAYEATERAQRAVIKCLRGVIPFRGRLPVKIT